MFEATVPLKQKGLRLARVQIPRTRRKKRSDSRSRSDLEGTDVEVDGSDFTSDAPVDPTTVDGAKPSIVAALGASQPEGALVTKPVDEIFEDASSDTESIQGSRKEADSPRQPESPLAVATAQHSMSASASLATAGSEGANSTSAPGAGSEGIAHQDESHSRALKKVAESIASSFRVHSVVRVASDDTLALASAEQPAIRLSPPGPPE